MYIPPHCVVPCNPNSDGTIIVITIEPVMNMKNHDHGRIREKNCGIAALTIARATSDYSTVTVPLTSGER